jgi:tripartite-type tricarboxylate transporter receptor subunit TctC
MAGIDLVHVPYKGGAPATTDLISGQVSLLFNSIPSVLQHMRSGRVKALAVGSATRSPAIPEIPTVAESAVPGFEYETWYGLLAAAGTPRPIVMRLNEAVVKALRVKELEQQLRTQGSDPRPSTPEELAKFMRIEHSRWERVVKVTGLAAQ